MSPLNRRQFVKSTLAAGLTIPGILTNAAAGESQRRIRLGLIGCGWYGMMDVKAAFKAGGVEVVALCDADSKHLADSAAEVEKLQGSKPAVFKHYRELLDVKGLEAVIIASPPQWHALMFIAALEKGLDVYCEKPLAYDIREGQAMVAAAEKSGRIVQIGFQRRQSAAIQQAAKYIQDGNIGKVIEAQAQIHYTAGLRDTVIKDPPETLDWDLWCGPAPKIPYSEQVGHFAWRLEKTTGHGHLVDWGIHLIDATRLILNEQTPRAVSASGGIYHFKDKITTPDILSVCFEFDACPVFWRHRIYGAAEYTPDTANGIFFYGEKATVFVTDSRWEIIPKARGAEREKHEAPADMGTLHIAEFLDAIRTRRQPSCSTADAHKSTATVKLAMIAYDTARRVEWNPETSQIPNSQEANNLLLRPYRQPHQHPYTD